MHYTNSIWLKLQDAISQSPSMPNNAYVSLKFIYINQFIQILCLHFSHGVLSCPFFGGGFIFIFVCLVESCNFWNQGVIGIWISE